MLATILKVLICHVCLCCPEETADSEVDRVNENNLTVSVGKLCISYRPLDLNRRENKGQSDEGSYCTLSVVVGREIIENEQTLDSKYDHNANQSNEVDTVPCSFHILSLLGDVVITILERLDFELCVWHTASEVCWRFAQGLTNSTDFELKRQSQARLCVLHREYPSEESSGDIVAAVAKDVCQSCDKFFKVGDTRSEVFDRNTELYDRTNNDERQGQYEESLFAPADAENPVADHKSWDEEDATGC